MKKILLSVSMIAAVAALVWGSSRAFFTDVEKSTGNTFETGTIDISVNGENPWNKSWHNYLDKPMETNFMNFTIKNVGENPARLWKKLTNVVNASGIQAFDCVNNTALNCADSVVRVSSEPECEDGTANFTQCYVERNTLSSFMVYDMSFCVKGAPLGPNNAPCVCAVENVIVQPNDPSVGKPIAEGGCWRVIIDENSQVRVDNVVDSFIELTDTIPEGLAPGSEMVVSQSYRLMTWSDSGQPMVTNWAQGDTMTFDVMLEARQISAPAPGFEGGAATLATAFLVNKNTTTWAEEPSDGSATLSYNPASNTFDYNLTAAALQPNTQYQLIYYSDPWDTVETVHLIGDPFVSDASGNASVASAGIINLGIDIPSTGDDNSPVGGKVWIVPTSSLSGTTFNWINPDSFIFNTNLVKYDDTNN